MSSLELRWRALSDLLTELRAKGVEIPPHVVRDLRSARSLIETLRISPECGEAAGMAEELLLSVEAYLLAEAEVRLGPAKAEEWARRLSEAALSLEAIRPAEEMRFRPGLPRGEHWMRVKISDELPRELLERLAEEEGVSARVEPDGFILISGDKERVKALAKRLAEHVRGAR